MPALDGCEVVKLIRSRVEYRLMPVLMLTASTSREDEIRCRAAGADDFLHKPVEIQVLIDHIRNWIAG